MLVTSTCAIRLPAAPSHIVIRAASSDGAQACGAASVGFAVGVGVGVGVATGLADGVADGLGLGEGVTIGVALGELDG